MKLKRALDSVWRALRRSFLLWLCCSLLAGLGVGLALDFRRLGKAFLMWRLVGTGSMSDGKLRELLGLCGFRDYPRAVDLLSAEAEYRAEWVSLSLRRRALSCYVLARVRPDMEFAEGGHLEFSFLFDEDGELLLSSYDDHAVGWFGMCDINLDGVWEKVVSGPESPGARLPAGADDKLDHKLEVYRFGDEGAECVFRARYSWAGEWSRTRGPAGWLQPMIASQTKRGYPSVLLKLFHGERTETLAEFRWDPETARLSGPLGGPGERWRVDFSHGLPATWGVHTPPPVVLPRFLFYGLPVSAVLIAVGWVLRGRGLSGAGGFGVRARLVVILGVLGAVTAVLALLVGVWLRPRVVMGKALAVDFVLLPSGRAALIEETNAALQTETFFRKLRTACDDADLTAEWNAQTARAQAFLRPDDKVQVTFSVPVYCVREFSWRDLSIRYVARGGTRLEREVEERNVRAIRGVAEMISKWSGSCSEAPVTDR